MPGESRLHSPLRPRFQALDEWDATAEENRELMLRKAEEAADRTDEHDESEDE